ncbi:hypothetical protein Tco_0219203 [Tanacetum coccineum]
MVQDPSFCNTRQIEFGSTDGANLLRQKSMDEIESSDLSNPEHKATRVSLAPGVIPGPSSGVRGNGSPSYTTRELFIPREQNPLISGLTTHAGYCYGPVVIRGDLDKGMRWSFMRSWRCLIFPRCHIGSGRHLPVEIKLSGPLKWMGRSDLGLAAIYTNKLTNCTLALRVVNALDVDVRSSGTR